MKPAPLDARLSSRIESFADEIATLVRRAALIAVEDALGAVSSPRDGRRRKAKRERVVELAPEPPPMTIVPAARRTPRQARATQAKLSLDEYERMALMRALAESGGHPIAAAKALGLTKSSIYRRMKKQRVPVPTKEVVTACHPDDPLVGSGEPLDLASYEKAALVRAIDECRGDKLAAARRLGIGKSTLYRLVKGHGLS